MNETAANQFYSFLIFIGIGILIVLLFDIFRILRKSFKTSDSITLVQDIIFGIIAGIVLLYSIFKFNSGELRLYIFLAMILGGVIYTTTISSFFIKINVIIIQSIKKVIIRIITVITFPFNFIIKCIRRLFFKQILFFFINFKKFFTNITRKTNNITRKNKVKKGF